MNRQKCTYDGDELCVTMWECDHTCGTMADCRYKRAEPEEVCSWCCDTADVDLQIEKGSRYCARCGKPLTGSSPKRPSLPDGYEWVPESVGVIGKGWKYHHKAQGMLLDFPGWRDSPECDIGNAIPHDMAWYCRPVKPDCDAEFEKWWGGDRWKLCYLCKGIPCDACEKMSRSAWRAARGQ